MKNDISERADIDFLVRAFYEKARADSEIGYVFSEVAKTDFGHHLPIMVSFWAFLLLGEDGFRGNMMAAHLKINEKEPLTDAHFERWLKIWSENIDQHFAGPKAEEAKTRARSIGDITRFKLKGQQTFFKD